MSTEATALYGPSAVYENRIRNLSRLCADQAALIRQYEVVLENSARSLAAAGRRITRCRKAVHESRARCNPLFSGLPPETLVKYAPLEAFLGKKTREGLCVETQISVLYEEFCRWYRETTGLEAIPYGTKGFVAALSTRNFSVREDGAVLFPPEEKEGGAA